MQHGDGEQLCFRAAEDVHRVQCVEAIDACLVSLNKRFDQVAFLVLSKIETVLIAAANGMDFDLGNIYQLKDIYAMDPDFENLHGELKFFNGIIKQRLPESRNQESDICRHNYIIILQ